MPVWEWILIAAVAVLVVDAVIVAANSCKRPQKDERLKQHFGPEYERTVVRDRRPTGSREGTDDS